MFPAYARYITKHPRIDADKMSTFGVFFVSSGTDALDLKVADLCGDAAGSRCIAPDALASRYKQLTAALSLVFFSVYA